MKLAKKAFNVAVALSGGVDSSVAALLLKQNGFRVVAVFMTNWDDKDETGWCSTSNDLEDAKHVCHHLNIPLHEANFVKEYWSHVFTHFLDDYQSGLTPNPDILCNKHIKFDALINYCVETLGVDAVATGHYAQTSYGPFLRNKDPVQPVRLIESRDKFKDQTFFLSQISQWALRQVMFPIGGLLKSEVKQIAWENSLPRVTKKKESTGICFVGNRKFQEFISGYVPASNGTICDLSSGVTLGNHSGLHLWTIGQRCPITGFPHRFYVAKKNVSKNTLFVVPGTTHPALYCRLFYAECPHWITGLSPTNSMGVLHCRFRFQHTKPTVPCQLIVIREQLIVMLERALKAITPGQYAVFYKQGHCLGSARIRLPGPSLAVTNHPVPKDYRQYENLAS